MQRNPERRDFFYEDISNNAVSSSLIVSETFRSLRLIDRFADVMFDAK